VRRVKKNRFAKMRWQKVKVLIVDEVSMLGPDVLEKVNRVAQLMKNCEAPFGGIQLLFGECLRSRSFGDFGWGECTGEMTLGSACHIKWATFCSCRRFPTGARL